MNIIEKAYTELFPGKDLSRTTHLKYSGRFSSYNANVQMTSNRIEFRLSKDWKGVSEEIKMGLLQHLMSKLWKTGGRTNNMDLYDYFLKSIHLAVPPQENVDPLLLESFERTNEVYCDGLIDQPTLVWGRYSKTKLGSYEYASDKIVISSVFKDAPQEFLDSVMHHEILHKKHKFKQTGKRCRHHTPAFRADERKFKDFDDVERRMKYFLARKKVVAALPKGLRKWFG